MSKTAEGDHIPPGVKNIIAGKQIRYASMTLQEETHWKGTAWATVAVKTAIATATR